MRLLLGVILSLTVLVLAGCSGDDEPAGPPLPSGRTPAPTAPDDAGPASQLSAKFLAGVDGKYVYRYTGPIGQLTEGILTVYRLGVNDRHDWTTNQFGFDATTVSIMAAEDNFLCTVAGSVNNCRVASVPELQGIRVISSPIFDALAALATDPDKFEFEELGKETFAGVTGACYRAFSETRIGEGPPSSEEIKGCYTEEGAVLFFERTTTPDSTLIGPSSFVMELQEATDASPSDFEPTGAIQ